MVLLQVEVANKRTLIVSFLLVLTQLFVGGKALLPPENRNREIVLHSPRWIEKGHPSMAAAVQVASVGKPYRPGIVAVFRNDCSEDLLLVCKRKGSQEWQFPQGGWEAGETTNLEQTLYREVLEELGNNNFEILEQTSSPIRYDFPCDMQGKLTEMYRGQEHTWFLCGYAPGMEPDLAQASDDEFEAFQWVSPKKALEGIIAWKRPAYQRGLAELGFVVDGE
jgi:putative (di)nucleoside polyphosphate hydrolase